MRPRPAESMGWQVAALVGSAVIPATSAVLASTRWQAGESLAWPRYPARRIYVLNGSWDFAFLGDVSLQAAATVREEDLCRKATVPDAFDLREWLCGEPCPGTGERPCRSCCDLSRGPQGNESCWQGSLSFQRCCDPVSLGRRGVGAYRTFLPREVTLLHFHACSMRCVVYVNRHFISEHVGGYSPFWVNLEESHLEGSEELELLVLADNRFSPDWPVHQPYFDWYQGGGLLRAVEAHALRRPQLHLLKAAVLPRHPVGQVSIELRFSQACVGRGLRAKLSFDGVPDKGLPLPRPAAWQSDEETWWETVPNARVWSPSSPALHVLTISLWDGDEEVDNMAVRFGLRSVATTAQHILINSHPVVLKGVNRHETHSLGGAALPTDQLLGDLQLLRQLGANFVRGSHYSQDQRWLDLCDEQGLLVWEETLGWQPTVEHMQDRLFMLQQLQALDETLNASANHPSVIMWGFLNEADSESELAIAAHKVLTDLAHQRDPTRLVSWASRRKTDDVTLHLADVISFNDYPGWYHSSVDEIPTVWQRYADWVRREHPGKPLLASEVGADGLAGYWSSQLRHLWSEDLQAAIVRSSVLAAHLAGLAGVVLWQFADSRVDSAVFHADNPQGSPLENVSEVDWVERFAVDYEALASPYGRRLTLRPRSLNSKGLLSLDRQHQKMAFHAARHAFRGPCLATQPNTASWPEPSKLVAVGGLASSASPQACLGCPLSVHVWNTDDRAPDLPGIRVHGHEDQERASLWTLMQGGLVRLAGHADGRHLAPGAFLSAAPGWPGGVVAAVVEEAASTTWLREDAPMGFLLRVAYGPACGWYLSLQGHARDEASLYAVLQEDRALATVWQAESA